MSLTTLITDVTNLIALTIPIAVAIAFLVFFWGIFQGFGKMDSVDKRAEVRQALLWSLVALLVIVALGGIVALFGATFPDLAPA